MGKVENEDDRSADKQEKPAKGHIKNRANRNKSEKDRRDKLNDFISELAAMVPGCSSPSRKLDKATILKNTVDFMKIHNDLTVAITCKDTTSCLSSNELGQLMLEGSYAFLFVVSVSGIFKFFSESVQDLMGYSKDELLEKSIFDYANPDDKSILLKQLNRGTGRGLSAGSSSFCLRLATKLHGSEAGSYETLSCTGCLRTFNQDNGQVSTSDENDAASVPANEVCFVVLAEVTSPKRYRDVSKWVEEEVQFSSRQSMDGKFLYLDPRCILITGYLPYEILGSIMYDFIHSDDLERIAKSFESLIELGEGKTEDYRILTKGRQWIVIKTSSYISYNHWNSKPELICSTHTLVRNPSPLASNWCNKGKEWNVQVPQVSSAVDAAEHSPWDARNAEDGRRETSLRPVPPTLSPMLEKDQSYQRDGDKEPYLSQRLESSTARLPRSDHHVSSSNKSPVTVSGKVTDRSHYLQDGADQRAGISTTKSRPTVTSSSVVNQSTSPRPHDRHLRPSVPAVERSSAYPSTAHARSSYSSPGVGSESCLSANTATEGISPSSGRASEDVYKSRPKQFQKSPVSPATAFGRFLQSPQDISDRSPHTPDTPGEGFGLSHVEIPVGGYPLHHQNIINTLPQTCAGPAQGLPSSPTMNVQRFLLPPAVLPGANNMPQSRTTDKLSHFSHGMEDRFHRPIPRVQTSPPGMVKGTSPLSVRAVEGYPKSPSGGTVASLPPPRAGDIYSGSPPKVPIRSPQQACGGVEKHSLSPIGGSGGSPRSASSMIDRYPQSPPAIPEGSPQSPSGTPDRHSLSSLGRCTRSPQLSSIYSQSPSSSSQFCGEECHEKPSQSFARVLHRSSVPTSGGLFQPCVTVADRHVQPTSGLTRASVSGGAWNMASVRQKLPENSPSLPVDKLSFDKPKTSVSVEGVVSQRDFPSCPNYEQGTGHVPVVERLEHGKRSSFLAAQISTVEGPTFKDAKLDYPESTRKIEFYTSPTQVVQSNFPPGTSRGHHSRDLSAEHSPDPPANRESNPTSRDKIGSFIDAQKILQEQLVEKQNYLQGVIQNQKRQLAHIQQQICLNAQAQFTLHNIIDLETSKQLHREAHMLEIERKQHETQQRELKSYLVQKINPTPVNKTGDRTAPHARQVPDMAPSGGSYSGGGSGALARGMTESSTFSSSSFSGSAQEVAPFQVMSQSESVHSQWAEGSQDIDPVSSSSMTSVPSGNGTAVTCVYVPSGFTKSVVTSSVTREVLVAKSQNISPKAIAHVSGESSGDPQQPYRNVPQMDTSPTKWPQCTKALPVRTEASGPSSACRDSESAQTPDSIRRTAVCKRQPMNELISCSDNSTTPAMGTMDVTTTTRRTEDYFSKFSFSELETFLSTSSRPSRAPSRNDQGTSSTSSEKEREETPTCYDSLLQQQKQLLQMQEDQRHQLLARQQEQLYKIRQQHHEERVLLQLQQSSISPQQQTENQSFTSASSSVTSQTPDTGLENPESRSSGGLSLSDRSEQSSILTYDLSEEDHVVINMLLAEGNDFGLSSDLYEGGTSDS